MAEDIKFNIKAEVSDAVKELNKLNATLGETDKATKKAKDSADEHSKVVRKFAQGLDGVYYAVDQYNRFIGKSQKLNGELYKTITEYNKALEKSNSEQQKHISVQREEAEVSESTRGLISSLAKEKERVDKLAARGDVLRQDGTRKVVSSLDELEKKQKTVSSSTKDLNSSVKNIAKDLMSLDLVGPFVKFTSVAGAAQAAVNELAKAIKDSFAGAIDWQLQIQEARQFGLEFKNAQEIVAASSQLAVKYAGNGAQEVEALQKAAAVGYKDLADAYEIVDKANLLVAGSGAHLSEGVQALTGVMKSYNLEVSEAGQVTDLLYKLTRNTNIGFTELSDAFSRGAQAAGALGIDLKEVLAISTVLNRTGMKSNETFTATRALIESLANPTERAKKAVIALNAELAKAGKENVAVGAQAVSNKGVMGVLFGIQNAAKGLGKSNAQVQELIKNVTGLTRASTPAFAILKAGAKEADKILKDLGQSAGAATEGFQLIQQSLSFQSKQKTSAFMTGLEEGFMPLTEQLGKYLSLFDSKRFENFGRTITATLSAVLGTISSMVMTVVNSFTFLWDHFTNIIGASIDSAVNRVKWFKAWVTGDDDERIKLNTSLDKITSDYDAKSVQITKKFFDDSKASANELEKVYANAFKAMTDPEGYKAVLKAQEKEKKKAEETLEAKRQLTEAEKKLAEDARKQVVSLEREYNLLGKNAKQKKVISTFDKLGFDSTKLIVDETGKIVKGYETLTPELQSVYEWLQKILLKQEDIKRVEEKKKDLTDWSQGGGQRQSLLDFYDNYKQSMLSLGDVLTNAFSNVEDSIVDFCRTGKLSFSDMVDSMIEDLLRLMIQQQMAGFAKGISGLFTASNVTASNAAFVATTAATGGYIQGPGTGTSDSIPAWLSNGEFVMNAQATAKYLPLLKQMNENKFARGGLVGGSTVNNGVDIQVIDQRGANAAPIQTSQQQGPDGRKMIKMLVRDSVKQGFANGSFDSSMHSTYGIRRAAYQR